MSRRSIVPIAVLLLVVAVPGHAAGLKSRRADVAARPTGVLTALWRWAVATVGVPVPPGISVTDTDAGWQMDPNGTPAPKR